MKKIWLLALAFSLILGACALPALPTGNTPAPQVDLPATAEVFVQQTLQAQPTPTVIPSNTPVVTTPTLTEAPATATLTATETQNSSLLTLTATLGTAAATTTTPTGTRNPSIGATPTETLHPRFFGTVPPRPPSGTITLINKAKAEAYVSLQCTANDGEVTIIEYPVRRQLAVDAPAGHYIVVAWVGGNKMTGSFRLDGNGTLTIRLYTDRLAVSSH